MSTMLTSALPYGPYGLTEEDIQHNVSGALAGAYALGISDAKLGFVVKFVGRSSDDVRGKLLIHTPDRHPEFCFTYCRNEEEAYRRECELYHAYRPPDNLVHPAPPLRSSLRCSVCGSRR